MQKSCHYFSAQRSSRRRLILYVLLVLASVLAPASNAAPTVLVLGDSLSAGYGIDPAEGWVALMVDQLKAEFPASSVINASISGDTTGGGLARLPRLLQEHSPTTVIIELGANDGLRGFSLPLLEANLRALISQSQASGASVILVSMLVPPNYGKRYSEQFSATYSTLAAELGAALTPFLLEGVAGQPELIQADGLHPVAAAQPRILQNILPTVHLVLRASAKPLTNTSTHARAAPQG